LLERCSDGRNALNEARPSKALYEYLRQKISDFK